VLDPKLLRADASAVAAQLARRGFVFDVAAFEALEGQRKAVQIEVDRLRAERNANAKAVGIAKAKGQDAAAVMQIGESLAEQLHNAERQLEEVQERLTSLQLSLPNILNASVPEGSVDTSNVEVLVCLSPGKF
jgi:seryl-tRNA synthetase